MTRPLGNSAMSVLGVDVLSVIMNYPSHGALSVRTLLIRGRARWIDCLTGYDLAVDGDDAKRIGVLMARITCFEDWVALVQI